MHELSVAASIIDIVQRSVPPGLHGSVHRINVRLGAEAGVVSDSLLFYFDILKNDSGFENARLSIKDIPFTIFCSACNDTIPDDTGLLICPSCGGTSTRVVSGTEMQIVDIELNAGEQDEPHRH